MIKIVLDRSQVFDEFQFIVGNMQSLNYDVLDIVKLVVSSILNHKHVNEAFAADVNWYVDNIEYEYLEYEAADKEWLKTAMFAMSHTIEVALHGALAGTFDQMRKVAVAVEETRNHDIIIRLGQPEELKEYDR